MFRIMERKMRRFKQLLSEADSKDILNKVTNGVLSLLDPDGDVYGVPVSFSYDGERTYICTVQSRGIRLIVSRLTLDVRFVLSVRMK